MKPTSLIALSALALALAACSSEQPAPSSSTAPSSPGGSAPTVVRVVSHDSFNLDPQVLADWEAESGYTVEFSAPGDAGTLVNQLILTKEAPLGDVAYGVDNVSAHRGINEGVFAEYQPATLPASAAAFTLPGLTPIDRGDVCLNADLTYFEDAGLPVPQTFSQLLEPEYAGMLVTTNAATSSPGVAIMLATIAEFGPESFLDYWAELADGGLRVAAGWSEAYYTDFTAGGGGGTYPLVTSYASSPAYDATTAALLDTCYTQIEYAGVLNGAQNEAGAQAFIEFLLSPAVQASIPEQMYMYPIDSSVALPEEWAENAPLPQESAELSAEQIVANLQDWIVAWTDAVTN